MSKFAATCVMVFLMNLTFVQAQNKKFLQVDLGGGVSVPVLEYKSADMFTATGYSGSAGFDYFFGRLGLGVTGGYFVNPGEKAFSTYISKKYLEEVNFQNMEKWSSGYALAGSTLKLGGSKFSLDLFAKAGYSYINVPHLQFNKTFFNQSYEVYKFSGTEKDWQFAWDAGIRLVYNIKPWFGLQAKSDLFSTRFMSDVAYTNSFREAMDGNRNGIMEDSEYFESQKMIVAETSDLSVVNINLGLIINLGRKREIPVTQMVPDMSAKDDNEIMPETQVPAAVKKEMVKADQQITEATEEEKNIPVANLDEAPKETEMPADVKKEADKMQVITQRPAADTKAEPIKVQEPAQQQGMDQKSVPTQIKEILNPEKTNVSVPDAPEARYDQQAAEHLYNAGEAYFADNDFENAIPCFNKLKADPKYPRARYMFALSLCASGNCEEAKKEYREFARSYKEDDARTLEIIFASHFEKCALSNHPKKNNGINNTFLENNSNKIETEWTEYKVQFIALRKSDKQFPKVADIGLIGTEFFKDKTVYRYSLGGYTDMDSAVKDVMKIRKMGFRDAFIAVYKNGVRVNTLYHAK